MKVSTVEYANPSVFVRDLLPGELALITDEFAWAANDKVGLATFSTFVCLSDPKIDWIRKSCTLRVQRLPAGTRITLESE